MNNSQLKYNFVSVSGYGWTGARAWIDILKEFKGIDALNGEFRIAKDPYGLIDLEESLVYNWDFMRHDVAIRDFINYCEMMSRGTGLFKRAGKDFSRKLHIDFMEETSLYIDKLVKMRYYGDTFIHRYKIPAYKNFIKKVRSKMGKENAVSMYLSRPSEDFFIKETKNYINRLFSKYAECENLNTIVLDQAIPTTNINKAVRYFDEIKLIIIDRDPRDIYANSVRGNRLLGPELIKNDSSKTYITWHKMLRKKSQYDISDKNVLRLYFEDFIFKYDESIDRITKFLDIDYCHNQKGKYFKPSDSIKNVGLWKKYKNQAAMSEIYDELESYCYKE